MKKLIFLSAFFVIPIFSLLGSADQNDSSCCFQDCCPPKDPCAKCAQIWPSCGPDWIITPGAGPCVSCGFDVMITVDFLYWAVRQDHMAFAYELNLDPTLLEGGRFFHPKWRVEPGFRVGLGWLTCLDGWDLYLNYTWLRPETKRKTVKTTNDFEIVDLAYTFGNIEETLGPLSIIKEESAKWNLDFNVLDLEFGRNFYISSCLQLRPHFGLKGTWQCQEYFVEATALQQVGSSFEFITAASAGSHTIDYWGIGPRAGLKSVWHFTRCFSFLGEVSVTALWGQFDSESAVAIGTETAMLEVIPQESLKTTWHTVKPVLEMLLGFRWEDWWCCDQYYSSLDIGWEVQWWEAQNQYAYAVTETRWGDLAFQGLTLRARFMF